MNRRQLLQLMMAAPLVEPLERTGRIYSFIWDNPLSQSRFVPMVDLVAYLKLYYTPNLVTSLVFDWDRWGHIPR
jgi:hypothetical protein